MAITLPLQRMQRRAGQFYAARPAAKSVDALERPCADEHDIARIDVNWRHRARDGAVPTGCTGCQAPQRFLIAVKALESGGQKSAFSTTR